MRELPRVGAEVGGYRIVGALSRGGMATVYEAEDLRMGRTVALKVLSAELGEDDAFRTRFLHETRVAAAVNHPNVIPVYDAGEHDGLLYLAMRRVEGCDLRELLGDEGPLDVARTASIVSQAAGALTAVHERGLVHRDVKPANILLVPRRTPDGTDHVYLSDFGLAKPTDGLRGMTRSGQVMGTVDYIAPEQVRGQDVDRRADVYALGCVAFECVTGVSPFRREDDVATVLAHVGDVAPRASDVRPGLPRALDDVLARALAKAPADRHPDCDALGAELRAVAAGESPARPPLRDPDLPITEPELPAAVVDAASAHPPEDPAELGSDGETGPTAARGPATVTEPAAGEPAAGEPAVGGPARRGGPSRGALAAVAAALVALAVVVALVLAGGGDDDPGGGTVRDVTEGTGTERAQPKSAWRELAAAPVATQQVATAVVGNRIASAGGLTGKGTALATVEFYDPAINVWTTGPDLPHKLHHAFAVAFQGDLVVMGGWQPQGQQLTAIDSKAVYRLHDGRWERLPDLLTARVAGAAAVVGGRIVVVGGQAGGRLVRTTEAFDGTRWREVAPMPTPREHLAAVSTARFLYAVGGRDLSPNANSGALERYDPRTNRWARFPSMPKPAGGLGAAIVRNQLVAVGGEDPSSVIAAVQDFDLTARRWRQLAPLPTPRHGLAVAATSGTLYALLGAGAPGHTESTGAGEALDFG